MSDTAAQDTASRQVTAIAGSAAKVAAGHTPDATPPTVTDFTLDIDQQKATITFSETVAISNIAFDKILIQPTDATSPNFPLTGGALISSDPSTIASFTLVQADVDALKLQAGLATQLSDSAMSAGSGLVSDMNNIASVEVTTSGDNGPVDASTFQADVTAMTLNTFTFDLNAGKLSLVFNEPCKHSSFAPTAITLQNAVGSGAAEKKTLTSGTAVASGTANGHTIVVDLSDDDLNAVKVFENLGTTAAKTVMVIAANAFTDIAGRPLNAIEAANGKASTSNTPDSTLPTLTGVAVDMDAGTVTLNFDEPIRASSLTADSVKKITLNSNKAVTPTTSYTLTEGSTDSANGLQIIVKLGSTDLNALKKDTDLVTGTGDSFVSLGQNAFADMAGKQIAAVATSAAVQATAHKPDASQPTVTAFTLNMNTRRMVVTFSETMVKTSFKFNKFTLQTSSDAKPAHQHTLEEGTMISSEDGTSFEVEITEADANQLLVRLIGSEEDKTWMTVAAGAAQDTLPQNNIAVVNGANAIKVKTGQLVEDTTKPTLDSFDLDMNDGKLLLKFSTAIDDTKIVASGMTIIASTANGAASYELTTSRVCTICANTEFIKTDCTRDADTVCEACKTCSSTEFYATACTNKADASCTACASCSSGQYIAGACTGFSDTECAVCTASCPANSFKTADCSDTADLQCSTCKVCGADEFQVSACTTTEDTVCQAHATACDAGKYITKTGTKDADITCATCETCSAAQFEVVACGVRDRKCKACSTAESGFEFVKTACTTTADAVIEECGVCGVGKFQETACAGSTAIKCTDCSVCPDGKFVSAKCTEVADTTCSACPANCKTCGTSGKCAVCDSGFSLTVDYKCHVPNPTEPCPDRFFKASDGSCDYCDQSAKTCTGPTIAETTSCIAPYTLLSGQCKNVCDDALAPKNGAQVAGACRECHGDCETCFGKEANECRTCPSGKKQYGYQCADACPAGWYDAGSNRCRQCSAHCKTCSDGSTTCSECTDGKILDSGFCHDVCPDPLKFGSA